MRALCFAIVALLVSACASVEWTKLGVSAEERAADARQCQQDALREASWQPLDRTYSYGALWLYPDPLRSPLVCMRSKGYDLTEVKK
jgi:hypothetical protein